MKYRNRLDNHPLRIDMKKTHVFSTTGLQKMMISTENDIAVPGNMILVDPNELTIEDKCTDIGEFETRVYFNYVQVFCFRKGRYKVT